MNHYLEARQSLRNGVSLQEFKERLPEPLVDKGLLSLLVGTVMEQGLEPFDGYLQLLTGQGADLNYCQYQSKLALNGVKMSLLMFACKKTTLSTVRVFLGNPNLQVYHRDTNGRNALHYAIENASENEAVAIVKLLLDKYPNLKEMGNYPKGNYLTLAIREVKPLVLQLLIIEEIDPNFRSLQGLGPLHEAVRAHKAHKNKEVTLKIIRILFEAGVSEEEQNSEGQTYLGYARDKGFLQETDIDQILEAIMVETTPKATIETSPEDKLLSVQSAEMKHESEFDSESQQSEGEEPNHYQISAQMYQQAKSVQEEHGRVWNMIVPFYRRIQKLVNEFYGSMQVIGSFASQLWIPSSDIDILLIIPDGGDQSLFQEITDILYKKISQTCPYTTIKLIKTYKLPLIKLILSQQYEKLELQLFLSSKKNIASRYVSFINQIISYFPEIAIIYYVLRRLLAFRRLHDHRSGGLKAYALFLLIYSMRNMYQYPFVSQFVEHFCYYYGFAFEYQTEVSSMGDLEYHINIVDPLNSQNNMGGKRTDIMALQQTLKKIYYCLNTPSKGKKMGYIIQVLKYL